MPIRVEIQGVEATYDQGEWSCADEPMLRLLQVGTDDTIHPADPQGLDGVREIVRVFGGEIIEVTAGSKRLRDPAAELEAAGVQVIY